MHVFNLVTFFFFPSFFSNVVSALNGLSLCLSFVGAFAEKYVRHFVWMSSLFVTTLEGVLPCLLGREMVACVCRGGGEGDLDAYYACVYMCAACVSVCVYMHVGVCHVSVHAYVRE